MNILSKAALIAAFFAGLGLADAAGGPGPDFQPLDKAKAMALATGKGIAVYSITNPGGPG